jgi:serine protease
MKVDSLHVAALAASASLLIASSGTAHADIPGRGPESSSATLWKRAHQASPSGAAEFVVGLKARRTARGIWRDRLLVSAPQRRAAEHALERAPGVEIVYRDTELPAVTVRVDNVAAVRGIRRLASVDYVDPLYMPLRVADFGCNSPALSTSGSSVDAVGDVLPWSFSAQRIAQAWGHIPGGPGAGITVGVIDTGVNQGQTQLQLPQFTSGMSSGRTVSNLGSNVWSNDSPWGQCNHGTRMAGLIAAPRDGTNIVGIAWKANLTTVHTHDSVVIGSDNASDIVRGIRKVVNAGGWPGPPKIITLAFGNPIVLGDMHYIEDQIRETYYSNANVLFLGAAGTDFCLFGLAFPGYLPEVTTIAGVAADRRTPSNGSCAGDAVDLAAIVGNGNIETTGRTTGEVVGLGGSSGATATIAGVAAMVWSRYPSWSRDQVRARLEASGLGYRDSQIGYGVPDAYKAVGGFTTLQIGGAGSYEPGQTYTLRANTGFGDGPFVYQWSTGQTGQEITRVMPASGSQTTTVTVTDLTDGTTMSAKVTARPQRDDPPCGSHCPH